LELGESRFRSKIFQRNLLSASHQLESVVIYVCIRSRAVGDDRYGDDGDGDDGDGDDGDGDDGEC
jgi:hypothetical protein